MLFTNNLNGKLIRKKQGKRKVKTTEKIHHTSLIKHSPTQSKL